VLAGAVITAAGLTFGSLTSASALPFHHAPGLSIDQQAAKVHAEDAYDPVNGNNEPNPRRAGRPDRQTAATINDLTNAGYARPEAWAPVPQAADLVQVRYPQVHLQPGLLDRGRLRRPVQ
jgi:hypothetical protein